MKENVWQYCWCGRKGWCGMKRRPKRKSQPKIFRRNLGHRNINRNKSGHSSAEACLQQQIWDKIGTCKVQALVYWSSWISKHPPYHFEQRICSTMVHFWVPTRALRGSTENALFWATFSDCSAELFACSSACARASCTARSVSSCQLLGFSLVAKLLRWKTGMLRVLQWVESWIAASHTSEKLSAISHIEKA